MIATIDLTDEQRAVAETADRVTVCTAAPGSGKTATVAARVAHLIENGVAPESIRTFVFTRSAAEEVRNRIDRFVGQAVGARVDVCTFHEFAVRVVMERAEFRDLAIATETDCDRAVESLYTGGQRLQARNRPAKKILRAAIMFYAATSEFAGNAQTALIEVIRRLRSAGTVPLWAVLPQATTHDLSPVAHVIVDELQDITPTEGFLARQSWDNEGSFLAVGDPNQAIFGWRFANATNALSWSRGEAINRSLTLSFRFGFQIAAHANGIIDSGIVGAGPDGEVRHAESIETAIEGLDPRETAILARTNHECDLIQARLAGWGRVVRRDPNEPLEDVSDHFAETWDAGKAVISTVHSMKGRECPNVIVAMRLAREGEERNLAYVAVTRPERTLILTEPVR